ncbi:hypothetical protein CBR_g40486 [Chara braunii]|uniref:ABC transporter domain-containing protein n=1 Tax=Chara braunii TaxID=69332 RepID=A0A388LTX0_CHABU|nr:hypothetical protein CBR_g40486 [Chara braunii]|eukprot:GBG85757.1 hypothetical protein CBR_g40486 [Chara braunii]
MEEEEEEEIDGGGGEGGAQEEEEEEEEEEGREEHEEQEKRGGAGTSAMRVEGRRSEMGRLPHDEVAVTVRTGPPVGASPKGSGTPPARFAQGDFDDKTAYTLTFQNLTYKVTVKQSSGDGGKTHRELLKNISGEARHGEILAIVGPSGAGKSTLLDALAGRITASSLEGVILANGKPVDGKQFRKLSGYVMQDDALFPHLTVKETLMFSARLRLPGDMPMDVKAARVDMLIATLGLRECADTRIGNEQVRGVSGGERRRVSIGVDLIHDPAVLFLDEPTSGLDSTSSLNVVQNLYQIATNRRRTIVMTIHQPSFRILELIHKIMILSRGSLVYSGTYPNLSIFLTDYGRRVPDHVNVLEFALDVIEELQESPQGVAALADFNSTSSTTGWSRSQSKLQPSLSGLSNNIAQLVAEAADFATSPFTETSTLCHRNVINIVRTRELFVSSLGLMIITGIILGSLFYGVHKDDSGKLHRSAVFAFACAVPLFSAIHALPIFLLERNIFMRETSRGAYRTSSYVVANALVFLPFFFIQALLFTLVSYFLVGLVRVASAFFLFATTIFLTITVGNTFVTSLGSLVPNFIAGNTIITAITGFMFLFSGFFVPKDDIPEYWIWFHYISTFKYPVELLQKIEYSHIKKWENAQSENGTYVHNRYDEGQKNVTSGSDVARQLGFGGVSIRGNLAVLVAMVVVYRIVFCVGLRVRSSNMRK